MKRDIPREHIGEYIEEALAEAALNGVYYLDGALVNLEADGHVSVKLLRSQNKPIYDIRVSRRASK